MTQEIENKIALVTGASRGIGRGIAEKLGRQGAFVVGTATTEVGAQGISQWMSEIGMQGVGKVLDVKRMEQCADVVGEISDTHGPIQILVNNAGIVKDGLMMRMKESDWHEVINTNLTSVYHMTKVVLKGMTKAHWGRIVNISSVVGSLGNAGQVNYAAAKSGMDGMTRAMAAELGVRNVTVNSVAPGFIDTDMTNTMKESYREILLGKIPLGRLGTVQEVAALVAFLASDESAYITGQTLHVNGGMYMA